MKKYIIFLLLLPVLCTELAAQESTLLHFMRWSPQSMRSNPANLADTTRFYLGIPLFSNMAIDVNSGFSYGDLITRSANDSLHINRDILNVLNEKSRFSIDYSQELFSFGIRLREDNMITFSMSAKTFGSVMLPLSAMGLLLEGNTPGGTVEAETEVNGAAYAEAALGYTRRINNSWKVGGRVKYLAGLANAYGKNMKASVYTDPDSYAMTLKSDMLVRTSYLDPEDGAFANSGLGFDLGAYYKSPVEGLEFSLSMVDWGWITWNSNVKEYHSYMKDGEYRFEGLDGLDDMDALSDTLEEIFKFEERELTKGYSSTLPGKIYLGTSYNFTPEDKLGLLISTHALHNFQRTTFGLMYSRQVGNWFTVAAGNNFMLTKLFNPSVAMLFRVKGFQFHLVAENISAFNAKNLRTFNFQFGMNIAVWAK